MKSHQREWLKNALIYLLVFTFIVPVIPLVGILGYSHFIMPKCSTSVMPFETVTEEKDDLAPEDSGVEVAGVNGEKEVCKKRNGDITSTKTLTQPVDEVYYKGTYGEPSYEDESYNNSIDEGHYQPSAVCDDGTYSYSQNNRGTCSWHGGVSRWLY